MVPELTKKWSAGFIAVRVVERDGGEKEASVAGLFGNGASFAATTTPELRQMAEAMLAAAEHMDPSPTCEPDYIDGESVGNVWGASPTAETIPECVRPWGESPPETRAESVRLACLRITDGHIGRAEQLANFVIKGA